MLRDNLKGISGKLTFNLGQLGCVGHAHNVQYRQCNIAGIGVSSQAIT